MKCLYRENENCLLKAKTYDHQSIFRSAPRRHVAVGAVSHPTHEGLRRTLRCARPLAGRRTWSEEKGRGNCCSPARAAANARRSAARGIVSSVRRRVSQAGAKGKLVSAKLPVPLMELP